MGDIFLGADIGGTKTAIGAVTREQPGKVVVSVTIPTLADDPGAMVQSIADKVWTEILPACDLQPTRAGAGRPPAPGGLLAIGIGCPGPLDLKERRPGALPNLPQWNGFPMCDALEDLLGVPLFIDNDANVAGLGERVFGAGKTLSDFVFVTLGTGIGGAVVAGGRVLSGHLGGAGEIGHIQVDPEGPLCGCGKRGCVESLASGPAIERAYGKPSTEVFTLALGGDVRAREVLEAAGRSLGAGLAAAVTLLDPEAVIFGGGMSQANPNALGFYLDACRAEMEARAYRPWGRSLPFLVSSLGPEAAVLGAAWLARDRWDVGALPPGNAVAGPAPEARLRTVAKPWGEELWWAHTPQYVGKRISVRAGQSLSLQYHLKKTETLFFVSGEGVLILGDRRIEIRPDMAVTVAAGVRHRVIAGSGVIFYEASTPEVNDVIRVEDEYGRAGGGRRG